MEGAFLHDFQGPLRLAPYKQLLDKPRVSLITHLATDGHSIDPIPAFFMFANPDKEVY